MPLAPAHPAVVLPLQRLGLPLSALVAGAVAPDAPVYLPVPVSYETTHSGRGLVADVAIGVGLLWLWSTLVRDAVVDLTPFLRRRVPARARPTRAAWLPAVVAVAVGAATHVLWDSATHDWGFVVQQAAALREEYGPMPGYRWLQHGSTLLGTVVVAAYCRFRLGERPVVPRPPTVPRATRWPASVPLVAVPAGLLGGPEAAVGAVLLTVLAVSCLWRWAAWRMIGSARS